MSQLDPVQIAALDFAQGKQGVGWFLEQGLGNGLPRSIRDATQMRNATGINVCGMDAKWWKAKS